MLTTQQVRITGAVVASLAFIGCIIGANYLTTNHGFISFLGVSATAGTLLAGATFVLRDAVQDLTDSRWYILTLILIGAAASLILALTVFRANESFLPPGVTAVSIAIASGIAFGVSELCDWGIYQPLRKRGYVRAATASNLAGAFVDTVVFLAIAGFPIWSAVPGQMVGKMVITVVTVAGVFAWRAARTARLATA